MSSRSLISALIAFVFTFSSALPSQAFAASRPAKTEVILIQDAHSDEASQLGIEKLLQEITAREKVDFIALEGAWTRLTPEVLEFSRNADTNRKILLHLLKHGDISGADLFAVSHKSKFVFEGVEDKKIYKKYFDILKNILLQYKKAESFSKTLRRRLMDQSSRELNSKLRDLVRLQEQYIEGGLSPLAYLEVLKKIHREEFHSELTALQNQIEYPNTLRVLALKKRAVSKKAEAEYKKFRTSAGPGSLRSITEAIWDKQGSFSFSENLKSALRFHILEEELAGAGLFAEIDAISEKLLGKLASGKKEKSFLQEWKNARLLSKLLKLEISPEDWASIKEKSFYHYEIDSLYQQARAFYSGAQLRDQMMAKNLIRLINSRRAKKAVLITGGFHTAAIQKLLHSSGIQTRVMTPEREIKEAEGFSQLAGKISLAQYRDSILHTSIALPQIATMAKPDAAQPATELLDVDPAGVRAIRHRVREALSTGKSLGAENAEPWLAPWEKLVKDPSLTRDAAKRVVLELLEKTGCRASAESIETYTQMYLDGDTYPGDLEIFFAKRAREQKSDEEQAGKNRWDRRSSGEATTGLSLGTKSKPSLRAKKPAIDIEDLEDLPLFRIREGQKTTEQFRVRQHAELNNNLDQLASLLNPGETAEGVYMIYYGRQGEKFKKYEIGFFLKTSKFPNGTALSIVHERKKDGVVLVRGALYSKGAATNRVYSPLTKTNGRSLGENQIRISDPEAVRELAEQFLLMEKNEYSMALEEWDLTRIAKENHTEAELLDFFTAMQQVRALARETGYVVGNGFHATPDALQEWSEKLRAKKFSVDELRKIFQEMAAVQPFGKPKFTSGSSLGTDSNNQTVTWKNLPGIIKQRYGLTTEINHTLFSHDEQIKKRPFAIIITPEEWRVHIDVFDQSAEETLAAIEAELQRMRGQKTETPSALNGSGTRQDTVVSTLLNDSGQQISAHSLGAVQNTASQITDGLIDPKIAAKSPVQAQILITQLEENDAASSRDRIERKLSSISPLDLAIKILMPIVRAQEKRPVLNIFTSDQLSEDVVNVIRYLHWLNPQERTVIAVTFPIPERMTAKIAAIKNVHMIRYEKIGEHIDAFKKEFPAEDVHKTITVTAPQFILDSLSNYSGVNFITPIAENAAFKTASARERIGALLAERSAAHLLAYHRGDVTAFEKLGLGGILTPANGHTAFAPRYDLNWSAIASSLGKLVDEWRGIEALQRSA